MPKITQGNRLYLYRLFANQIGIGRQEKIERFTEVLEQDDILPDDLDCATAQDLLAAMPEFIKLTVFKKGRVYATVVSQPEWDAILARADEPKEKAKGGNAGAKSWKRKKGSKDPKPAKPRHKPQPKVKAPKPEPVAEPEAIVEPEVAPEPTATPEPVAEVAVEPMKDETQVEEQPKQVSILEQIAAIESATVDVPAADSAEDAEKDQAPEPEATPVAEPEPAVTAEPKSEVEPEPAPEPAPAPEPSIKLTITYDPYDLQEEELAKAAAEAQAQLDAEREARLVPEPPVPAEPQQLAGIPAPLQRDLPQDFSADVHCKDELLRVLYQTLPIDADVMRVLDEDWRVARSTGTLTGTRSKVTFPLRYLQEDGIAPVEVTLKRSTKTTAGKHWSLAYIDGDDGTGTTHEGIALEGLPKGDEGAWSDLVDSRHADSSLSPARELAQFAVMGSWEGFLGGLATAAAPENWNYAGEGVGQASRYGILREYIAVTFHRIIAEGKLAIAEDNSLAAFNTGLLTPFCEELYVCFVPHHGDIAWQLAGFCTAGSGDLGSALVAKLNPLPQPATYLESLDDVRPQPDKMVILDTDALLGRQLGRMPRAFLAEQLAGNESASALLTSATDQAALTDLARTIKGDPGTYRRLSRALDDAVDLSLRRTRSSYRLAVPVYDPSENRTKLLLPLCLVSDNMADCAIVLSPQPSGNYQGTAILTLERALACARVVSADQPGWLLPARPTA